MKTFTAIILFLLSPLSFANNLEKGIELFNQREYKQAIPIFESLSNAGDIEATYWLGASQYRTGEKFEAGHTYLKAAEKGNPWAMDRLVPRDSSPCSYLSWPCDEKWKNKAITVWKQQAENGSGKAMSMLLLRESPLWQIIPFYNQYRYNKLFEKAIPLGGYTLTRTISLLSSKETRYKHLLTAANHGYAPAMTSLFYYKNVLSLDERLEWCLKALNLGYSRAAGALSIAYSNGSQGVIKDKAKAIYYMLIKENLNNNHDEFTLKSNVEYIISDEINVQTDSHKVDYNIDNIKSRADKFTENIKPNMFLDESSFEMRI
ncbi:tetratricopeptide repeat protein [Photobacterium kagoshimensis]|uniref:tetratricopeptide repeat protein n=1 Tax=Photobacterium kagoshimensis TaxID=2910242 RepID=UPI003D1449F7